MGKDCYREYVLGTINEYARPIKKKLLDQLIAKQLISFGQQLELSSSCDSILSLDTEDKNPLYTSVQQSNGVLKQIEFWEFVKNFKYSIPCELTVFDFDQRNKNKTQDFDVTDLTAFDTLSILPDAPSIYKTKTEYFIKFSLQQNRFNPIDGSTERRKRILLFYVVPAKKYIEIRFDFLDFPDGSDSAQDSWFFINKAKIYLEEHLGIYFGFLELDGITNYIAEDKNLNIVGQDMQMANGSHATLRACTANAAQNSYVLPFLGELKNLLSEYEEEKENAPLFYEALEGFIKDKEMTSDLPWIKVKWENGTETKITFNYKAKGVCLIQHYCGYEPADIGMERMNHVAQYIINYRKSTSSEQFN